MSARLTIVAPCDWINANSRMHWSKRAHLTRTWRHATAWQAKKQRLPVFTGQVDVHAIVHKSTPNRFDAHNLTNTAKAAIDGLQDAGVLAGDDSRLLRRLTIEDGGKRDRAQLVLIVTEVESAGGAA